ncbi:MAG: hypothetical protein ACRC30_11090 [Clostridium sp.]
MYAYYCLHKFNWEPSKFATLSRREKALVIAMIDERVKEEKKESSKMKRR